MLFCSGKNHSLQPSMTNIQYYFHVTLSVPSEITLLYLSHTQSSLVHVAQIKHYLCTMLLFRSNCSGLLLFHSQYLFQIHSNDNHQLSLLLQCFLSMTMKKKKDQTLIIQTLIPLVSSIIHLSIKVKLIYFLVG